MHISENIRELEPSATLAVTTLCKTMRDQGREVATVEECRERLKLQHT